MKRLWNKLSRFVYIIIGMAVIGGIVVSVSTPVSTNATTTETQTPEVVTPVIDLVNVAQLVNDERIKAKLQPLKPNELLNKSAQAKCDDMVAKDYWAHDAPDGSEPWHFIEAQGIIYQTAGENLAYGFKDINVVTGWMNSPGHRKNILDSNFTDVGYAQCESDNYQGQGRQIIVVQHLAGL